MDSDLPPLFFKTALALLLYRQTESHGSGCLPYFARHQMKKETQNRTSNTAEILPFLPRTLSATFLFRAFPASRSLVSRHAHAIHGHTK